MASEMMEALMALCQEKHIDELYLIDQLEQSLAKSYAEVMHMTDGARVTIDRSTGKVYVYELVPKEESWDDETGLYTEFDEVDVTPKDTSRTAAQHAKSVINEIVRNSARQQIYEEFSQRIGDIITGTVYAHNQRIRAIIIDVRDPSSGQPPIRGERQRPSIVVSRTHPDLIRRLFELEVPEVYDGVVDIRSVAREPGVRSKVAVSSIDDRLDPVGACVGPKGSRVRTVVSELRGERVDVVLWSDDPAKCVANALSPARVSRVIVDPENNYATVIVPDDQLSLAIGKEGQNARLAARLTGMHIDIKNESLAADIMREMPKEVEQEAEEGETRCEYVGPTGIRCRNMARPGSHYCGIHEKLVDLDDSSVTDDPDSLI